MCAQFKKVHSLSSKIKYLLNLELNLTDVCESVCLCMPGPITYGGSVTPCKYKLYKVETEMKDTIWPKAHFMQPEGQEQHKRKKT